MSIGSPPTNVVDLPCIPVRDPDGTEHTLSLRETFLRAHEMTALGGSLLPVEREGLLRFLESMGAAILKGAGVDELTETRRFPADQVDAFFERHRSLFDLADRERPLLQEWHAPTPSATDLEKTYQPIEQLHIRVPGGSSAIWGVSQEHRDAGDPAILLTLLVVSWFHGKPSNAAGASFYVPTSGTKRAPISGAPSGGPHDTVFHLIGDTLAESLLLSIPESWLDEPALPAWLDQDLGPDGTPDMATPATRGSLWRCTWTANRAHVRWKDGRAVSFTRGLTQRPVPKVGVAALGDGIAGVKEAAKVVSDGDYCRVVLRKGNTTKNVHANARLRSAEGFERWYKDDLATPLHAWMYEDRALMLPDGPQKVGFHHETGDTYGNRELSQWIEVPLAELVLTTDEQRHQMSVITGFVGVVKEAVGSALAAAKIDRRSPFRSLVLPAVMTSLDDPVLDVVTRLARHEAADLHAARRAMSANARRAFASATEPLITPATAAGVYRARSLFAVRTTVKESA